MSAGPTLELVYCLFKAVVNGEVGRVEANRFVDCWVTNDETDNAAVMKGLQYIHGLDLACFNSPCDSRHALSNSDYFIFDQQEIEEEFREWVDFSMCHGFLCEDLLRAFDSLEIKDFECFLSGADRVVDLSDLIWVPGAGMCTEEGEPFTGRTTQADYDGGLTITTFFEGGQEGLQTYQGPLGSWDRNFILDCPHGANHVYWPSGEPKTINWFEYGIRVASRSWDEFGAMISDELLPMDSSDMRLVRRHRLRFGWAEINVCYPK